MCAIEWYCNSIFSLTSVSFQFAGKLFETFRIGPRVKQTGHIFGNTHLFCMDLFTSRKKWGVLLLLCAAFKAPIIFSRIQKNVQRSSSCSISTKAPPSGWLWDLASLQDNQSQASSLYTFLKDDRGSRLLHLGEKNLWNNVAVAVAVCIRQNRGLM